MMEFVLQFIIAMAATIGFAILFQTPRTELHLCGFSGGIGWLIYYILVANGSGVVLASLAGTTVLTIFARTMAVVRRKPATLYLLTGIFPLVPGAGIYYTAYYMFSEDMEMFSDKGIETFEIAAAIVLGIIFGSIIPQGVFRFLFGRRSDTGDLRR